MKPYIISVDWFQVTCKMTGSRVPFDGMFFDGAFKFQPGKTPVYHIVQGREFNPIYKESLQIQLHGFNICTIYFGPRPSTLPKELCSVKMSNAILYSANWLSYLHDIVDALKWQIVNVSRVDLCADFNYFANNLAPREFIRRYLYSGAYDENTPSYIRNGSNKYVVIGTKDVKDDCSCHLVDYLRFGCRTSPCSAYLYNKTEELGTISGKRYILDLWERGGLVSTEDTPVYRLELSISARGSKVKRRLPQEDYDELQQGGKDNRKALRPFKVDRLALDDFGCQQYIESLFFAYQRKYFSFKHVGLQVYKHNWEDVQLFDYELLPSVKPYSVSTDLQGGVAERNAAHTLQRLLMQLKDLDLEHQISIENSIKVLERVMHIKMDSIDADKYQKALSLLHDGYTMDEVKRMGLVTAFQYNKIRELVWAQMVAEFRQLLCDSTVRDAIANYDGMMYELEQLSKDDEYQTFLSLPCMGEGAGELQSRPD